MVKDIVEAFRYTRANVLTGGWRNAIRTSSIPSIVSELWTDGSPYEHGLRVYTALAKGNLWLFMDIYPWLWYVLEYGLNKDGSLNEDRLNAHVGLRDADQFQQQSQQAMKELPFSANWMGRLKQRIASDAVYSKANSFFSTTPTWSGMDGGYGQHQANAYQAHAYVKAHVKEFDSGYRLPPSGYWSAFNEAFYVMEEERRELLRVAGDGAAASTLQKISQFKVTNEIETTYSTLVSEFKSKDRMRFVANIARDFDRLMDENRAYMEGELRKIRGWLNA